MTATAAELPEQARAPIYQLLGTLLLEEIGPDMLTTLRSSDIAPVLEAISPGCQAWLAGEWSEADFDEAAADYCQLFLLNDSVSPWAGAWLGADPGIDRARWLAHAEAAFTECGRLPETEHGHAAPPDHLGLLLYLLAGLEEADSEQAPQYAKLLLGDWVVQLGQQIASRAPNPLYRALGRLLEEGIVIA